MKNFIVFACIMCLLSIKCGTLKKLGLVPSELEMVSGLKAALEQGLLSGLDDFANPNKNSVLAFAMPNEIEKIEKLLQLAGVKNNLTEISNKLTTAMKSSVQVAKPVFSQALKDMSFRDASKILITDNRQAATDYFKIATVATLTSKLTPIIDSTVKLNGVDKEYLQIATIYNAIPFLNKKIEPTASGFIAGRTLDILFAVMAKEEAQIRDKYQFRKTDLLKKVFGYAEKELQKRLSK